MLKLMPKIFLQICIIGLLFVPSAKLLAISPPQKPEEEVRLIMGWLANRELPLLAKLETHETRVQEVRRILDEYFDIQGMGRFMLGRYWRQANDQERMEYIAAFESLVVQAFAGALEDVTVKRLKVTSVRMEREDQAIVQSEVLIAGREQQPFNVNWHLRRLDRQFKVYDVVFEGLSLGILFRDAFVQATQKGGGNVTDLIKQLQLMTRQN